MKLLEVKNLIENNPVAFSTVTGDNKPNVIAVDGVKVVSGNKILITDNFMNQTLEDIKKNNNICLLVWEKNLNRRKLIGKAEYFTSGKWKKIVEEMKENKGLPAKGAILIEVSNIILSK